LAFKAPESLRNGWGDSRAGDVWAIGTIAYLLLTDTLPYEEKGGPASFFGTQQRHPPRPPHQINVEIDEELDQIVLTALDPDPARRTPDADILAKEFARWRGRRSTSEAKQAVDLPQNTSKTVLGRQSPVDDVEALRLVEQALSLARQATTLPEAADVMEGAFNKSVEVRARYEGRLRLWRKGIVT
jgi:serine/threonine-protein kinase